MQRRGRAGERHGTGLQRWLGPVPEGLAPMVTGEPFVLAGKLSLYVRENPTRGLNNKGLRNRSPEGDCPEMRALAPFLRRSLDFALLWGSLG